MAHGKTARGKTVVGRRASAHVVSLGVACWLTGCVVFEELDQGRDKEPGSLVDAGPPDSRPEQCAPVIDRFRELILVDPSVVDDPLRTAPGGAWSFKHLMEEMKPETTSASQFVLDWLEGFKASEVNGFPVSVRAGVDALLAEWPKALDGSLDLDRAPFRLTAIANRLDLRDDTRPAGEGRLVFAALQNGVPAAFTVVFEYLLPTHDGRDAAFWAETWHSLGASRTGEAFNQALETVTRSFTDRGAWPERINGSALGQVRTNEILFGTSWELREFQLDTTGALRIAPTDNCPDPSFNGGEALAAFVRDHAGEVSAGTYRVPHEMLGGACRQGPEHAWRLPGVDERLRQAFARETCNGCHGAEATPIDGFYHVTPFGAGTARLSRFLHDPGNPDGDELGRRAEKLRALLCHEEPL